MTAVILATIIVVLAAVLLVLLRAVDYEALRARPAGLVSVRGLVAAVAGGFVLGLAYGALAGSRGNDPAWMWLGRGVVDGLVMACGAALYVGMVQRRQRGR